MLPWRVILLLVMVYMIPIAIRSYVLLMPSIASIDTTNTIAIRYSIDITINNDML